MTVLTDGQTKLARAMSEADLQSNVIALAQTLGWWVHAERPAQKKNGEWRTPIQGNAGFPDLVIAKRERLLFVELKRQRSYPTDQQLEWLNRLAPRIGPTLRVQGLIWRPSNWFNGTIEEALK